MQEWSRVLLIMVVAFSLFSFVLFLLGATAYFQRGMDIIGTIILIGVGIPTLAITTYFTTLLLKGWTPTDGGHYIAFFLGLGILILLSFSLLQNVSTYGLTLEKIESDTLKITEDEKYQYRIDLINVFQRNSRARLFLKDISSEEEMYIPVDIQTRKIVGLSVGRINHWVKLEPTDEPSRYILYTTEELGRITEEKFEIDIKARTSKRLD